MKSKAMSHLLLLRQRPSHHTSPLYRHLGRNNADGSRDGRGLCYDRVARRRDHVTPAGGQIPHGTHGRLPRCLDAANGGRDGVASYSRPAGGVDPKNDSGHCGIVDHLLQALKAKSNHTGVTSNPARGGLHKARKGKERDVSRHDSHSHSHSALPAGALLFSSCRRQSMLSLGRLGTKLRFDTLLFPTRIFCPSLGM